MAVRDACYFMRDQVFLFCAARSSPSQGQGPDLPLGTNRAHVLHEPAVLVLPNPRVEPLSSLSRPPFPRFVPPFRSDGPGVGGWE